MDAALLRAKRVARILIDAQQPSRAILSLENAVEIEPGDVESRVTIGRLLLRDLLYHYELKKTKRMVTWLDSALERAPGNRDALFLKSLALEMASGLPDASPDLAVRGRALVLLSRARRLGWVPGT